MDEKKKVNYKYGRVSQIAFNMGLDGNNLEAGQIDNILAEYLNATSLVEKVDVSQLKDELTKPNFGLLGKVAFVYGIQCDSPEKAQKVITQIEQDQLIIKNRIPKYQDKLSEIDIDKYKDLTEETIAFHLLNSRKQTQEVRSLAEEISLSAVTGNDNFSSLVEKAGLRQVSSEYNEVVKADLVSPEKIEKALNDLSKTIAESAAYQETARREMEAISKGIESLKDNAAQQVATSPVSADKINDAFKNLVESVEGMDTYKAESVKKMDEQAQRMEDTIAAVKNSDGIHNKIADRLKNIKSSGNLGANLGSNMDSPDDSNKNKFKK